MIRLVVFFASVILLNESAATAVLIMWIVTVWAIPRVLRDRQEIALLREGDPVARLQAQSLEEELGSARRRIMALEQELEVAQRAKPSPASGQGHPLFCKVGLDQDCPRWVAEVVRREYRKRLHPDSKPPAKKVEAERRFKEAEQVFGEIWRARRFQ